MAGFPLSFLTDRIFNTNTDSGNIHEIAAKADKALLELLDGLSNGETILAKVLSVKEDSFQILTSDNITINARAEEGVMLTEGSNVLFEVSKSPDRGVSLRPLYQNTTQVDTASAALKQASIPETARALEFVARRMEYGEPIDRNSLLEAFKDVSLNPEAPVKYIVDLQKMDIPVTTESLVQYEAYENMENSVAESFSEISKSLSDEITKAVLNTIPTDSESANLAAFNDTLKLFSGLSEYFEGIEEANVEIRQDYAYTSEELKALVNEFEKANVSPTILTKMAGSNSSYTPSAVLTGILKDLTPPLNYIDGTNLTAPEESRSALSESEIIKSVIEKAFSSQWSLDKDKISDKKEVRDLYERLFSETHKLLETLTQNAPKDSPLAAQVQNLSSNLDFMNALNQFVPYIQIPFKSESGNKASELYVFKNKHSLAGGDGEVSAFVHLDMTHLGPTDVYVRLKGTAVTTNFTLMDEETLEFIEQNLHFLDKRLTDKGYSFKSEANVSEKFVSPVERMLSETTERVMIQRTCFDARV